MISIVGPFTGSTTPDVLPSLSGNDLTYNETPSAAYEAYIPWGDGHLKVSADQPMAFVHQMDITFDVTSGDQYYGLDVENDEPGTWTVNDSNITLSNQSSSGSATCTVKIPSTYTGTSFTVTNTDSNGHPVTYSFSKTP